MTDEIGSMESESTQKLLDTLRMAIDLGAQHNKAAPTMAASPHNGDGLLLGRRRLHELDHHTSLLASMLLGATGCDGQPMMQADIPRETGNGVSCSSTSDKVAQAEAAAVGSDGFDLFDKVVNPADLLESADTSIPLLLLAGANRGHSEVGERPPMEYSTTALLELIKETPYLYDKSQPLYKEHRLRSERWSEIGSKFGMSGSVVFKKWTHARDRYKRMLNIVLKRQRKGESFQPGWQFFNTLHEMLSRNYLALGQTQDSTPTGDTASSAESSGRPTSSEPTEEEPSEGAEGSPVVTIRFADAAELHTAALRKVALGLSAKYNDRRPEDSEMGRPEDSEMGRPEGIVTDHFGPHKDISSDDEPHDLSGRSRKKRKISALFASDEDCDSKRSESTSSEAETSSIASGGSDCWGSAVSSSSSRNQDGLLDEFLDRINRYIRKQDKVVQIQLVNAIHQALLDGEAEFMSAKS